MVIKWNKSAIQQLVDAIVFIEGTGFYTYAEEVERDILPGFDTSLKIL